MADNELQIKIFVDNDGAIKAIDSTGAALKRAGGQADDSGRSFDKFSASIITLNQALDLAGRAFRGLQTVASAVFDLIDDTARVEQLTTSFDTFQQKVGRDAVDAIERLRKATGGLVEDTRLLDLGVNAAALGIDQGTDQFFRLIEAATKASVALGKDFNEAIAVINQGIGRLSPQILDNLGVTVKLGDVNEATAAKLGKTTEALTAQEQRAGLLEAVLGQLETKFGETQLGAQNVAQAIDKLEVGFDNFVTALGVGINQSDKLKEQLEILASAFFGTSTDAKELGTQIGDFLGRALEEINLLLPDTIRFVKDLSLSARLLQEAISSPTFSVFNDRVEKLGVEFLKNRVEAEQLRNRIQDLSEEFRNADRSIATTLPRVEDITRNFGELGSEVKESTSSLKDFERELNSVGQQADAFFDNFDPFGAATSSASGGGINPISDFFATAIGGPAGPAIEQGIANALQAGLTGNSDDLKAAAVSFGADLGNAYGGPIGEVLGAFAVDSLIEGVSKAFGGKTDKEANAREAFEGFLIDAFNAQNAAAVINGEFKELADLVDFDRDFFDGGKGFAVFEGLGQQAKEAFSGVGLGLSEIIGDPENLGFQFAAELAAAFEGDLFALRGAVDALGISFEELGEAVLQSAKKGELSFLEAESALQGIAELAQDGIPGALGAVEVAFDKVKEAGVKGGAASFAALKAIGVEAAELGLTTIPELEKALLESGIAAEDVAKFLEALGEAGVTSVDQLANAADRKLLQILADLESQAFAFEETFRDGVDELVSQLERIPEEISSRVIIDVETRARDAGAQTLIDQGFGEGLTF